MIWTRAGELALARWNGPIASSGRSVQRGTPYSQNKKKKNSKRPHNESANAKEDEWGDKEVKVNEVVEVEITGESNMLQLSNLFFPRVVMS